MRHVCVLGRMFELRLTADAVCRKRTIIPESSNNLKLISVETYFLRQLKL